MLVVLDTDVMVAALCSDTGASRVVLDAVVDGKLRIACSTPLMIKYEAVLTRPSVLARSGLVEANVVAILDELAGLCVRTAFDFRWRPVASDPDDDLVVETAVNAIAGAIVSFNSRDMLRGAAGFGVPVLRPAELLRRIGR